MKKYCKYAVCLGVAVVPMLTSCSDDDEKVPSREIVQIDIYQAEGVSLHTISQYKLTYDGRGRLSTIRTDQNSQEVNFTHGTSNISYRWEGNDPEDGLFVNRFEAELRGGKVQVGSANYSSGTTSRTFNYAYYYNNRGYITDATFGGEQSFSYQWGKQTLVIQGRPSGYDAEYAYNTSVQNNYSIDLNLLPLFVDSRPDIMLAMNVYGQLAGVLGSKYPTMLEDVDYSYRYQFDGEGRLVQIIQQPASLVPDKQNTYWFLITYAEE